MTNEEFICSILGDHIELFTLNVDSDRWHSWIRPVQDNDWQVISDQWKAFHQRNIRLFQGHCHESTYLSQSLIAVPNMPVFAVAEYCGTGAYILHRSEATVQEVQNILRAIWKVCPFEITFADPAALQAVLLKPITEYQAKTIEQLIDSVAPESIGSMVNEWGIENDFQYEDEHGELLDPLPEMPEVYKIIQQNQQFCICFDI